MSFTEKQLDITSELCEIVRLHNEMIARMQTYRKDYPWLMPPNVCAMIEDNLKENSQMLYKEMNNLHKPKGEQKRYTCPQCSHVFAAPLRGGLCDECRGRTTPTSLSYDVPPRSVDSESPTVVFSSGDFAGPGQARVRVNDVEGQRIQNELLAALAEMEEHSPEEFEPAAPPQTDAEDDDTPSPS